MISLEMRDIPGIGFREATIADCAAVAEVHVRSWKESFAGIVPQGYLDKMSVEKRTKSFENGFSIPDYKMYVAENAGQGIVGFVDFGVTRESIGNYTGELYAFYLLPEYQRKGIGEKLFNLVVDSLVNDGRSSMYLWALEVSPYRTFYEKMGGHIIARKQVAIEGIAFEELCYGWDKLCRKDS